jgi:hypothetical protein
VPSSRRLHGAGLLALACTAAALAPAPLPAQEEGILELRLTAVAETRTVRVLVDARGEPLVPLLETAGFLEIPVEARGDTLFLQWPPAAWDTRVDLARREVASAGARFVVPEDEWLRRGDEVFVSVAALGRILAGEARVDWENLGLVIAGRADYPITVRIHNLARRQGMRAAGPRPAAGPAVPYPGRSGGAAGAWGLSGAFGDRTARASARAALGVALLGGSLEGGAAARLAGEASVGDAYGRYARAFPEGRWLRQLELGDVRSDGLVTRPFFGLALTNAPLYAPHYFGEALIRPVVPAGWEYEVYQGEYLLGVSTRGSGEPVAAPIGYGTTPLRVRMVGPAGQERTEDLVFLVPAVQVPPGEWRYHLGGGACRVGGCTAFGYADVRHGVARSLTVGVGVDHTERDTAAATRPYGILSANPRPDLRAELRARAGALVHGTLQQYRRHGGWRLSGGWRREEGLYELPEPVWFGDGGGAFHLGLPGRGRQVGFHGRLRGSSPTTPEQWQAGVSSGYGRVQLGVAYESGFQEADVFSVSAHAFAPRHLFPTLRDLNLNGRVDLSVGALHGGALTTTFRPLERASVTAGITWNARTGAPGLSLAMVTRTPSAYLQTNTFSEGGRQGAFASAGGGVAVGAAPLVATPFETIGRAGVRGVAFYDEDGDGVRGPGEPVLEGVPVVIGGERAVTGPDGAYHAWGLLPYAVVSVGVDTLNLAATDVSPLRPEHLVRLTPNVYATVDLPLVRTREVVGTLRWRGTPRALGGITVEARREGDAATHRATTFSDGEFYFPRLPAGEYTLTVAESSLRALGGAVIDAPLRVTVPGTAGAAAVRIPPLELRPGG